MKVKKLNINCDQTVIMPSYDMSSQAIIILCIALHRKPYDYYTGCPREKFKKLFPKNFQNFSFGNFFIMRKLFFSWTPCRSMSKHVSMSAWNVWHVDPGTLHPERSGHLTPRLIRAPYTRIGHLHMSHQE